jgi:predicted nucleic acid-binding protein
VRFLLDTSVYSQPLRRKPVHPALSRWQAVGDSDCVISAATAAEIEWGLHDENNSVRWKKYASILENRLEILHPTQSVWSCGRFLLESRL